MTTPLSEFIQECTSNSSINSDDMKNNTLNYLGRSVYSLHTEDVAILETFKHNYFKQSDNDITEIDYYINICNQLSKEREMREVPFWEYLFKENHNQFLTFIKIHPERINYKVVGWDKLMGSDPNYFKDIFENANVKKRLELVNACLFIEPYQDIYIKLAILKQRLPILIETLSKCNVTEEESFEIAKLCAQKSAEHTIKNFQLFKITNKDYLIEIVKLCAQQNSRETADNFQLFNITNQDYLFEIAKHWAQHGRDLAMFIEQFNITDQDRLFEIAKIGARSGEQNITTFIHYFKITDQDRLFEIAKLCAQYEAGMGLHFKYFEITDQDRRFEIAKLCGQYENDMLDDYRSVVDNVENFNLTDQKYRFEIAKLCAQKRTNQVIRCIYKFDITDQGYLLEIAKLCARLSTRFLIEKIQRFKITNQEALFEIAKICAQQDLENFLRYFSYFDITNQKHLSEIAEICARLDIKITAAHIWKFTNLDENSLFEIAKIGAKQDGKVTAKLVDQLKLTDLHKVKIFSIAVQQSPEVLLEPWPYERAVTILKDVAESCFFEEFLPLIDSLEEVRSPHARKQLSHWIASTLYLAKQSLNKEQVKWLIDQKLLQAVAKLQIPFLRYSITNAIFALAKSDQDRQVFQNLPKTKFEKYGWGCLLRSVIAPLPDPELRKKIMDCCNNSFGIFKDMKKFGILIRVLRQLASEDTLTEEDRTRFLKEIFSIKGAALLIQCYAFTSLADFGKLDLFKPGITLLECSENVLKDKLKISSGQIEDLTQKYMESFGASRNPQALLLYTSKMASLNDNKVMECLGAFAISVMEGTFRKERYDLAKNTHLKTLFSEKNQEMFEAWKSGSEEFIAAFSSMGIQEKKISADVEWLKLKLFTDQHMDMTPFPHLTRYLNDPSTAQEVRNELIKQGGERPSPQIRFQRLCIDLAESTDKLKILEELSGLLTTREFAKPEFYNDVQGLIAESKKSTKLLAKVFDSDDPMDLLLCGTEVTGSCQRLDGDPRLNRGLLGYLVDGKNRLLAIKDQDGSILARCMLRLLWDGEKPVLFRERLYPNSISEEYANALNGMALKKAKKLGVPLTSSEGTEAQNYPKSLQALGGPAPFEYSDGSGGVRNEGKYTISSAKYFQPSEK